MKLRKKIALKRTGVNMKKALAATATVLGASLGVNIENTHSALIDVSAITLTADQYKFGAYQYKGATQIKIDTNIDLLGSTQYKFDIANQLKISIDGIKIPIAESTDIKHYVLNYFYNIPADVSPENPYIIPFEDFPQDLSGQPLISFLTPGIESLTYEVTADGLMITGVVPTSVPEPSSILLLGAGLVGMVAGRRLVRKKEGM